MRLRLNMQGNIHRAKISMASDIEDETVVQSGSELYPRPSN